MISLKKRMIHVISLTLFFITGMLVIGISQDVCAVTYDRSFDALVLPSGAYDTATSWQSLYQEEYYKFYAESF